MVLWIAMAVLAAAASLPVLAPLYRVARSRASSDVPAVAVYRDQLREVDRDVARGVIADSEADAARTEIARRLIRAGAEEAPAIPSAGRSYRLAAGLILAMPIAAFSLYLIVGSPENPDQPLASRSVAEATEGVATLIAAVEEHLKASPDDGEIWEALAPAYAQLRRHADAVRAYSNALRLLGATAEREANIGEAIVRATGGKVTTDARAAFERALALAPNDQRARFYLALALGQEGRKDEAIAAWHLLIESAPADAPWLAIAREELATLEGVAPAVAPAPTAEEVAAAATMAPEDRQAMIEGMVAALAARLTAEPGDADGWARLIRSYMVLGRPEDARDALGRARLALAGDGAKQGVVDSAAHEAGLVE